MSIIDRIRANGGEVIRDQWRISLRPGRMTLAATAWVKDRWRELCREIWPEFDDWEERAAIMEFDGGMSRDDAEAAAYRRVMGC
ncbi:hypothetical protein [Paracoccus sp. IB05]|uniref:hypothetical protein n=1 Tax=Paracoccus sp. IB05 TaxID=2779367 RepID=UPI0018E8826E|nr:hypothetical protein [Paracoccus sp. IB05]MBJ2153989.1 hypothetical protein [Paracoccus sp. IB05]